MSLRLPLRGGEFATIISVYVLPMVNHDAARDKFYEDLRAFLASVLKADKLAVLVQSTTLAVLGRARRQHQDWFDNDDTAISTLLVEKNRLHKAYVTREEEVPQDLKYATIMHLYKRKGNRQICNNHGDISLLNIAGKIFARILLNRLNHHIEQGLLPESHCGFRCHCGTTDMIFADRQLQEKCQEMWANLYSTFVDLTKAFDTVNNEGLWKFVQKFGCPERFAQMARQLHDCMMARVTDSEAVSEAFAATNGVRQDCALAPTLFGLILNGAQQLAVDNFTYLGSALTRTIKIDDEVAHLISKVSSAFGRLQSTICYRRGFHLNIKLKMCKAVIWPTLLYEVETWTMYKKQARGLKHFHHSCLRRILKKRSQDQIPDKDVLEGTGILGIYAILRRLQLRWSGHHVRMGDEQLPKRLLYGDVATGSHRHGGQVRRYKDTRKTSLKRLQINPAIWKTSPDTDRPGGGQ
nr:unnamed protein product [Spirometra erinaceieuropaei]